jgi:16S rRNA (guanine527-N7)-methyltransferase
VPDSQNPGRDEFLRLIPVPHETVHRLDHYAELLGEWNGKFNLIAESTIPQLWVRHFLDCAQLVRHIPEGTKSIADLGSGAGFPGLVLAILGAPGVVLIESIGKKADFLCFIVKELGLDAEVWQQRIESVHDFKADIVTARALKPLKELLKLASPLMKKGALGLFLKGQSVEEELTESARWWKFTAEKHPSLSSPSGTVLIIRDLQHKNGAPHPKFRRKR